jgi:hypothetical protein
MRSIPALRAKNRFGELLDAAQRERVTIQKAQPTCRGARRPRSTGSWEALKLAALRGEIRKGQADVEAGRTVPGKQAFRAVRKRLA